MQQKVNPHTKQDLVVGVKLGRSKYTIAILTCFLIGIFLGDIISIDFKYLAIIIVVMFFAIYFFQEDKNKLLIFIAILGFILGLTYYNFCDYRENKKSLTYNQNITFNAKISERPVVSGSSQQIIVEFQNTNIIIQTERYPEYSYGDVLKIKGAIKDPKTIKPFNGFDYGNYLLKKGVRGQILKPDKIEKVGHDPNKITEKIYFLGDKFNESINKVLPEPYASFQIGLLFGNKTNIPDSLMSAFNRTSTTHIVAVSGYNVTIIITAIALILARYSRKLAFFGIIFSIVFFVILTGAGASVLRAGLLAGLVTFARTSGRRPYFPVLILFTAVILLLFNPYALKNDVSFQLSFLAFIGLVLVSPILENQKLIKSLPDIIKISLAQTLGAQIFVLPILLYNFGTLSFIAPLANILVLPFIPVLMLLGFLTGFAGLIYLKAGYLIGYVAYIFLRYIIVVVQNLSDLKFSATTISVTSWWWIPLYYIMIFIWLRYQNNKIYEKTSNTINI
jgi:competence protein ComEC